MLKFTRSLGRTVLSIVKKLSADPDLKSNLNEIKVMDKLLMALANCEVQEVAKEILAMIKALPCTILPIVLRFLVDLVSYLRLHFCVFPLFSCPLVAHL